MPFDYRKYATYRPLKLPDRTWPDQQITEAPTWCSVDLRDGNQALIDPMTVTEKLRLFELLVKVGFTEIEVGFPAASQPDFDFVRALIEKNLIPDNVTIQVLTQARAELIQRTFTAVRGAKRAIVHLYNSTSPIQRRQVFGLDEAGIIAIAQTGAEEVLRQARQRPDTQWGFQYSPESFTATEPEFAVAICNAVLDVWQPTPAQPAIINLPATVEVTSPNLFADQVEYFGRHVAHRDSVIISLHTHNDRGCAVAAAELGVMAGAQRIEGTLLGNGERTGNMDIITMAMNLYSQGIDPKLNLSAMDEIISVVQAVTKLPIHPRHPYAGELVYTAFSGSHQDAIRKCLTQYNEKKPWQVAYLPIDPRDLGRDYEAVVRINSQSGKGGVAFVMEQEFGIKLPRWLQIALSQLVQGDAETSAREVSPERIKTLFDQHFLRQAPLRVSSYRMEHQSNQHIQFTLQYAEQLIAIDAIGQGALAAFCHGIGQHFNIEFDILDYEEHSLEHNRDSAAIAMVQIGCLGHRYQGVAIHQDSMLASLNATTAAINQALASGKIALEMPLKRSKTG